MSEKIFYYLGAGASVKALPLAKSVIRADGEIAIQGLAQSLRNIFVDDIFNGINVKEYQDYKKDLLERFIILGKSAYEFGDVDTYAKYLYLMGNKELDNLKRTLSEFFSIRQILSNARDYRYPPWIVSVMNKKAFPENIKILSWNYDFQVELAASEFGGLEDVEHKGSGFSYSESFLSHFPNLDPAFSDFNKLSLIHLNGIAGFLKPENFYTSSVFQKESRKSTVDILNYMKDKHVKPQIHFAWENSEYHNRLFEHIEKMINGVTHNGYNWLFISVFQP